MLKECAAGSTSGTSSSKQAPRFGVKRGRSSRTRLRFSLAAFVIVAAIGYMIYSAMQTGSEYYLTSGELIAMGDKAVGQSVRLGGRVVPDSIQWDRSNSILSFALTDGDVTLPVIYKGIAPDSFQAGADVIVEGKLGADGSFKATTLLAKCASKYTPE